MRFLCTYERHADMRYDFDIYAASYESAHRQARVVLFNIPATTSADLHRRMLSLKVTPVTPALELGQIAMRLAYRG